MRSSNWLSESIFYQIMPDRFARAEHEKTVTANESLQLWSARPGTSGKGVREFYGGNLKGITAKLEHIKKLGTNAILLTPINQAPSFHRYDTTDFRALDPMLGTWEDLAELIAKAHDSGIRMVFDIAFNHVSREHPWFQTAQKNPLAREREYFRFLENGKYHCWWGYGDLPELQLNHPDLQNELFLSEDSVLSFWLKKGFDGVRLDCANDLTLSICHKISQVVKENFPHAAVIGEVSNYSVPWLNALDATQSYFFTASIKALQHQCISHAQFQRNMAMAYGNGAFNQFQMLSSHDTPRTETEFASAPQFLRAARRLQFTLPGIPMLYYGEEFAMRGGKDPDNRATIDWEKHSQGKHCEEFSELQQLISLRNSSPELKNGIWQPIHTEGIDEFIAFFRASEKNPQNFTLVAWNDSPKARSITLTIPWGWLYSEVELKEVFTRRKAKVVASLLTLQLNPQECSIWQINPGNKGPYTFYKEWDN